MKSLAMRGYRYLRFLILILAVYGFVLYLFSILNGHGQQSVNHTAFADNTRTQLNELILKYETSDKEEDQLMAYGMKAYSCTLIGTSCNETQKELAMTQEEVMQEYTGSLIGSITSAFTFPFVNPPASGLYWAQESMQKIGFVPQTYAAEGIGFAAIKPVSTVWKVFRDASYLILVLVIVSIGFLVMFRTKINAQTVITAEEALPRIVITLLLITFSFPIAGFLIDIMYFVMALMISLLGGADGFTTISTGEMQNRMLSAEPSIILSEDLLFPSFIEYIPWQDGQRALRFLDSMNIPVTYIFQLGRISTSIILLLPGIVQFFIYAIGAYGIFIILEKTANITDKVSVMLHGQAALGTGWGGLIRGGINLVVIFVVGFILAIFIMPIVMGLLILFTLLLLFLRIFVLVLTTYLKILLLIIFAPLYILLTAVPGQNTFSTWLKTLFGELMTFPIISTVLVLGHVLVNEVFRTQVTATLPTAAITHTFWSPPFLYGLNQSAYAFLIGTGLILIIPEVVKFTKDALGIKASPINIGLNTFFKGGTTVISGGAQTASKASSIQQAFFGDRYGFWDLLRGKSK
ncbi:MAG: hypothetical protein ACOCXQ_02250 [Patescibacteria group bacterium]